MTDVDPAAVRALAEAVEAHDGVAAFSEQALLNLGSGEQRAEHLPVLDDGALVAYAQLDGGSAELAVHPYHRGRGQGGRLLDEVLRADDRVRVWAHGPHPAAAPLAASRQLSVVRELWLMVAPAPGTASAPPVPDGIRVTTFDLARDADDWVVLNGRAFAEHPEQGRMTRGDLEARAAEPWFDPAGFWLARDARDDTLLGAMWTKVSDAVGGLVGEIYVLGIDPAAQGRGLGGFLTAQAMHHFAGVDGLTGLELYVEGDNEAAIRTYQRAGFHRERADLQYARA